MRGSRWFRLAYAPEVYRHIATIEATRHRVIRQKIEDQLSRTPDRPTRNRKPLERLPGPLGSTWELRFGPANRFRVFYDVLADEAEVWILAIGVKARDRLYVGGREYPG